jgi:hypothetical protein
MLFLDLTFTSLNIDCVKLLGSCTPGTVGHRLRPMNLDTTDSLQRQTAGEPITTYQI